MSSEDLTLDKWLPYSIGRSIGRYGRHRVGNEDNVRTWDGIRLSVVYFCTPTPLTSVQYNSSIIHH